MAETSVEADEIDTSMVQQHLHENEEKLINESLDDANWEKVQHEIARLRAELDLVAEGKSH